MVLLAELSCVSLVYNNIDLVLLTSVYILPVVDSYDELPRLTPRLQIKEVNLHAPFPFFLPVFFSGIFSPSFSYIASYIIFISLGYAYIFFSKDKMI